MIKFVTLFPHKNLNITIDSKSWVRSSNQFTSFGLLLIWLPMFWVRRGSPKHGRSLYSQFFFIHIHLHRHCHITLTPFNQNIDYDTTIRSHEEHKNTPGPSHWHYNREQPHKGNLKLYVNLKSIFHIWITSLIYPTFDSFIVNVRLYRHHIQHNTSHDYNIKKNLI